MTNILLSLRSFNDQSIYEPLSKIIKKEMKVAVLVYSFFEMFCPTKEIYESYYEEGKEYYQKILESFSIFGIDAKALLWIDYYKDSKEDALKKLEAADVIYLPGGAPDEMMIRIKEKALLNALNDPDKIYVGVSAGAMIQLGLFHISADHEYPKFGLYDGLGHVNDLFIEVHYRRRRKQKSSLRYMFRTYKKPIYIIPNEGGLIIKEGRVTCIGNAKLFYDKKGIVKS